jgi:hypothetical protein
MKIGVTKTIAMKYGLKVSGDCDGVYFMFLTEIENKIRTVGLLINSKNYYSRIFNIDKKSHGLGSAFLQGGDLEYCVVKDGSERARFQAVTAKAKSIYPEYIDDIKGLEKSLNGIPWKFLGFSTPAELN